MVGVRLAGGACFVGCLGCPMLAQDHLRAKHIVLECSMQVIHLCCKIVQAPKILAISVHPCTAQFLHFEIALEGFGPIS